MIIAITGNIGSGKSSVASLLGGLLGGSVVDVDTICRDLMMANMPGWIAARERLGERFFPDGNLDRALLRQELFSNHIVRSTLEDILHPMARSCLKNQMDRYAAQGMHLLAEVPLLYEAEWAGEFDVVVAVYSPESVCRMRTVARDGVPYEQVDAALDIQISPERKAELADYVIDNSGTWAATVAQSEVIVRNIRASVFPEKEQGEGT